jgi:hypothetical protein
MAGDEQTNGHGKSRLDRLEGLVEVLIEDHLKFRDEHRQLLTSQVVLTDRVDKLAVAMAELARVQQRADERLIKLAEAQEHTDGRINALINVVDDLVRKRPPQAP